MGIVGIIGVAIEHRQRDFRELDGHSHETHDPHPEHRARSAQGNSERHTADVAEAHGRRQGSGQRLKMVNGAGIIGVIVTTADHMKAVGQRAVLAKTAPDGEQQTGAEQQIQHRAVPDDVVERDEERGECFHPIAFLGVLLSVPGAGLRRRPSNRTT